MQSHSTSLGTGLDEAGMAQPGSPWDQLLAWAGREGRPRGSTEVGDLC